MNDSTTMLCVTQGASTHNPLFYTLGPLYDDSHSDNKATPGKDTSEADKARTKRPLEDNQAMGGICNKKVMYTQAGPPHAVGDVIGARDVPAGDEASFSEESNKRSPEEQEAIKRERKDRRADKRSLNTACRLQHAVCDGLDALGVDSSALRERLVDEEETSWADMSASLASNEYPVKLSHVTPAFCQSNSPMLNLLRALPGVYIVMLKVVLANGTVRRYGAALSKLADEQAPRGKLLNSCGTGLSYAILEYDVHHKKSAIKVWKSLLKRHPEMAGEEFALDLVGVYQMQRV